MDQDDEAAETSAGGSDVEFGDLCAQHLGRVLQLGLADHFPFLRGVLLGVRHSPAYPSDKNAGPDDMITEVSIGWNGGQVITLHGDSRTNAFLRDPSWGVEPFQRVEVDGESS